MIKKIELARKSLMKYIIFYLPVFLTFSLLFSTGIITRHDAFNSVFSYFPERQRWVADGYIGVNYCSDLGKWYILKVNNKKFLVFAADCRQKKHQKDAEKAWGGEWIADLDKDTWGKAELPGAPVGGAELREVGKNTIQRINEYGKGLWGY